VNPGLFVAIEGIKGLGRVSARWVVWALSIAIVLIAGTALIVLPARDEDQAPRTIIYLIASVDPGVGGSALNQLVWSIWSWPGVSTVSFRFPGETEPRLIEQRSLLVRVLDTDAQRQAGIRLEQLEEITHIDHLRLTTTPPPRLPATSRILALVGLVLALPAYLLSARWAARGLGVAWGDELALLRYSGVNPILLRLPFWLFGALAGFAGAALYSACYWGVWAWAQGVPAVRQAVPTFVTGGAVATALGIFLGLALGVIGGTVGFPARRPS